jgi:hypothetical protein
MLRKPDPPVLVAVTKEPAGRIKTSTVQILDYNLNRWVSVSSFLSAIASYFYPLCQVLTSKIAKV